LGACNVEYESKYLLTLLSPYLYRSVVWTALLSAWYPPEEEAEGEVSEEKKD